jgi:hypothetical protein
MNVHIILKRTRPVMGSSSAVVYDPLAQVELEVVPKGEYVIDGTVYETVGVPKFIIDKTGYGHTLNRVELTVQVKDPTGV